MVLYVVGLRAWEPLGATPAWFSEIDLFPSEILKHHWPDVENLGDMTKLPEMVLRGDIEAPDVLVGGTPCQSFSLAGMREGLSDDRGQLTVKFVELVDAIDTIRRGEGKDESIIVWENVHGIFSSKDNAFGCFLAGLAGEDSELQPSGGKWTNAGCVYGPKRTIAWRVLDAQYFGVAQRRRRVFVVTSAREGFDPTNILFESEGLRRDVKPRFEDEEAEYSQAPHGRPFDMLGFGQYGKGLTSSTCKARDYKDATDLVVMPDGRVRRLTPVEHERLQGFPDGFTQIPWRNKPKEDCPIGHRYKALGNSMAVPCMRWIGERLFKAIKG